MDTLRYIIELFVGSLMDHIVRQLTLRDAVFFLASFVTATVLLEVMNG